MIMPVGVAKRDLVAGEVITGDDIVTRTNADRYETAGRVFDFTVGEDVARGMLIGFDVDGRLVACLR